MCCYLSIDLFIDLSLCILRRPMNGAKRGQFKSESKKLLYSCVYDVGQIFFS